MASTTVTTRAVKGSALTHTEMDTNWNNLNNVGCYVGMTVAWFTGTSPSGDWLECDGRSLAVASYGALHTVLGYTFGGSGANFYIPDLRGQFLRGWDHGASIDPDILTRQDRGDGTTGDAIGTYQDDAFKAHSHVMDIDTMAGSLGTTGAGLAQPGTNTNYDPSTTSVGGTETRPKNINTMWLIKAR